MSVYWAHIIIEEFSAFIVCQHHSASFSSSGSSLLILFCCCCCSCTLCRLFVDHDSLLFCCWRWAHRYMAYFNTCVCACVWICMRVCVSGDPRYVIHKMQAANEREWANKIFLTGRKSNIIFMPNFICADEIEKARRVSYIFMRL